MATNQGSPTAGVVSELGWLDAWLATDPQMDADGWSAVMAGLAAIDSASMAIRVRVLNATADAELLTDSGHASHRNWAAEGLRLTGVAASRELRLAAMLADEPAALAGLADGRLSRDEAAAIVAARRQQQADADAAARARAAAAEDQRRERERADATAQARAASQAERMRLAREAAAREREAAAARARAERTAQEAAARRQQERFDKLVDAAAAGASADALKKQAAADRAKDADAMERSAAAQQARRAVRFGRDRATGMRLLIGVLPDDVYEILQAGLAATRTFDHKDTPAEERRTYEQRNADAFVDLLNAGMRAGELPTVHGERPHIAVSVPLATLLGGDQPGLADFGSLLSPNTVRRLACDAALSRTVLDASGLVLELGRKTRSWNSGHYRAAAQVFAGCAFPVADGKACGRPMGWTDLHHVDYWEHGGCTDPANGVPLCRRHHNAVHHDGWVLSYEHATGTVTVRRTRHGQATVRTVDFRRPPDQPGTRPADRADGRDAPRATTSHGRRRHPSTRRVDQHEPDRTAAHRESERLPI